MLHLDASNFSIAGNLEFWEDVSGSGLNASQSVPASQPTVLLKHRYCHSTLRFLETYLVIPNDVLLNPQYEVRGVRVVTSPCFAGPGRAITLP